MTLHNFILYFKKEHPENEALPVENEIDFFSEKCLSFLTATPEEIVVGTYGNGCISADHNGSCQG